jgi:hypothetical protein
MQSAEITHELVARPQVQVVGVGEDDLGARAPEIAWIETFHAPLGRYGHKGRRVDRSVRSDQATATGLSLRGHELETNGCRHRINMASPYE